MKPSARRLVSATDVSPMTKKLGESVRYSYPRHFKYPKVYSRIGVRGSLRTGDFGRPKVGQLSPRGVQSRPQDLLKVNNKLFIS